MYFLICHYPSKTMMGRNPYCFMNRSISAFRNFYINFLFLTSQKAGGNIAKSCYKLPKKVHIYDVWRMAYYGRSFVRLTISHGQQCTTFTVATIFVHVTLVVQDHILEPTIKTSCGFGRMEFWS